MRLGKGSVCGNWLHENCRMFSKTCTDCGATSVPIILKNVRNLQRRKECHGDTEYRLCYLITVLFTINLLFYIALYVRHLSPRLCQKRPFARLCDFYCYQ